MDSNLLNTPPIISIISASFNCINTIEKSILSILPHLSTNNIEFIIIDGGSTDGTIDIIKKYEKHLSFWVSEKDSGIYDAWNKGILASKGKFISFIGLDDYLCSNYSNLYLGAVFSNSHANFFSSKMIINNSRKDIYGYPFCWDNFKWNMNVVHPGSLHSRTLFDNYGFYDMKFKIAGDYEFLLRCGEHINSYFIDSPTVIFSLDGVSNTKSFALVREVRRAKILNNSMSIIYINIDFIFRFLIACLSTVKKLLVNYINHISLK